MDETQEVETKWRSQPTHHHSREDKTVLVGLMVWGQIVIVEDSYSQDGGVRTETQVSNDHCGQEFNRKIVVVGSCDVQKVSEDGEDGFLVEERHFGPDNSGGENH